VTILFNVQEQDDVDVSVSGFRKTTRSYFGASAAAKFLFDDRRPDATTYTSLCTVETPRRRWLQCTRRTVQLRGRPDCTQQHLLKDFIVDKNTSVFLYRQTAKARSSRIRRSAWPSHLSYVSAPGRSRMFIQPASRPALAAGAKNNWNQTSRL